MIVASLTFRCRGCGQLLPFDGTGRVPEACLRRCRSRCDWHPTGPTDPAVRARAAADGPVGADGLPAFPRSDGRASPIDREPDRQPDRQPEERSA